MAKNHHPSKIVEATMFLYYYINFSMKRPDEENVEEEVDFMIKAMGFHKFSYIE